LSGTPEWIRTKSVEEQQFLVYEILKARTESNSIGRRRNEELIDDPEDDPLPNEEAQVESEDEIENEEENVFEGIENLDTPLLDAECSI
jgi:hypothetical protein